jgi:tRNA-specific 2-thiouridylase
LQAWARQKGFDCLATGHYARTHDGKLYKAKDLRKDQSYVLYSLSSEQLSYMRLPLGSYTKDEVRATAAGLGLANAQKEESQDICFVPDGNYAGFIETQAPLRGYTVPQPGRITRSDGSVVGAHDGIHHFTIGQRRGLGIAGPQPFYVLDIDAATDTVIVGTEAERGRHVAYVNEVNLMCPELFTSGMSLTVKHRYRGREHEARVYAQGGDTLRIVFSKAQRDLTKGQALVLYDGDLVVGGGTIKGTEQAPWHSRDAQDAQAVRDAQGVQDAKNAQDAQDAQDAAGVN